MLRGVHHVSKCCLRFINLAEEYKSKATIETIHYDQNKALAKELGIDEIPAFLFYKKGKLILRKNGLMEEADFKKLIEENL